LSVLGTKILESKKTAAPAFSFGARHMNKNQTYGPGPAQYNGEFEGRKRGLDQTEASSHQKKFERVH
jgi:hypothetical protein